MNMKLHSCLLAVLTAFAVLLTGCGGSGKTKMDTKDLSAAFATADASVKPMAEEAITALNAGKLFEGATALANVAKSADKLNDAQKDAMMNVGATIQMMAAEAGDGADLKVFQAVEDMIAGLDGREAPRVGTNPDRPETTKAP